MTQAWIVDIGDPTPSRMSGGFPVEWTCCTLGCPYLPPGCTSAKPRSVFDALISCTTLSTATWTNSTTSTSRISPRQPRSSTYSLVMSVSSEQTDPTTTTTSESTVFRTMLAGGPYHASDPHVAFQAQIGRDKVQTINSTSDGNARMELFRRWAVMNGEKKNAYIALPFFCEYVSTPQECAWCSYTSVNRIKTITEAIRADYPLRSRCSTSNWVMTFISVQVVPSLT
jgi:hypothetical protein